MGLRYSKSTSANTKAVANYAVDAADIVGSSPQKRISRSKSHVVDRASQISNNSTSAAAISIPPLVGPTINLQIEESPNETINGANTSRHGISTNAISANSSQSGSLNSVNNCARQIIIKIQLAKMENDNGNGELPVKTLESLGQSAAAASSSDLNANTYEMNEQQILNANELSASTSGNGSGGQRTAGSSSLEAPQMFAETSTAAPAVFMNNNNLNGNAIEANLATSSMAALKLNTESDDEDFEVLLRTNSGRAVNEYDSSAVDDYCEVLEQPSVGEMWLKRTQESLSTSSSSSLAAHVCTEVNTSNSCCRSKGKSLSTSTSSAAAVANNNKRRCCKCKCRDAIRGLSSAAIKVLKQKEPKETSERKATHSRSVGEHRRSTPPELQNSPSMRVQQQLQLQQRKRNSIAQMPSSSGLAPLGTVASTSMAAAAAQNNTSNQVSIWTPNGSNVGDVIIRISTPQFVMEQCANAGPVVTVGRISDAPASIRLMAAAECVVPNGVVSPAQSTSSSIIGANPATVSSNQHQMGVTAANVMRCNPSRVPIAHSQIDFVHFLVPDLERITNSSFYWGKMDRYEAERLLDGMPEGTFLLRDSAQEEFLFSVTFRKYERSLHARIEQSGHKFSFDSHDPCVFTAPTVTGLLEHYKDPSCVMFFEPMLTVPLHRKNPFSLQQLCRATIVSNTTYDGVNQLELPTRLKSYLKEYHYKQKLRVKPFDEPFYSCT